MIILSTIFIAITSFLVGFILGVRNEPNIKPIKFKVQRNDNVYNIEKEYQNFLSYDGSEQE